MPPTKSRKWLLILIPFLLIFMCCTGLFVWAMVDTSLRQVGLLPTLTPTTTRTATAVPTGTATPTATPTPAPTGTPIATPAPTDTVAPTTTPVPTGTPLPTATPAPADALASIARQKLGDKLITAELSDVAGQNVATVDYDQGTQWDEYGAVQSAVFNLRALAPDVFSQAGVDVLELRAFGDFTDVYGNTKKDVAIKFTVSRSLAEKINWKAVNIHRIGQALGTDEGSGMYVHPALQKAWNEFSSE